MAQLIVGQVAKLLTSLGLGAAASSIVSQIAVSVLLSAAANALAPRPRGASQSDVSRDLQVPRSLPPKRFLYGRARSHGSWAPGWVVNGNILYGCLLLNSRTSAGGTVEILLDKRPVELSGDIFDFDDGASATNAPFAGFAKFWMGRGDQEGPPAQIMTEYGDATGVDAGRFWPGDGWRGNTVLWCRFDRGPASQRSERWPSAPPELEVEADWSLVWDPRQGAQAADDPATWAWSDNQALCLLDALRNNPLARRPLRQIRLADFIEAANVADDAVPVQAGGTERRYRVGGLVVWSEAGQLVRQLAPLAEAGGGALRQAGGQVGYAAGRYYAAEMVVGDVLTEEPLRYVRRQSDRDVPRAIRAVFPDPAQQWEDGDLQPYPVPGRMWSGGDDRVQELRLSMVPFPRQAMRLAKIAALRMGAQERLSAVFPPEVVDLLPGARLTVAFPGEDARNGIWQIEAGRPAQWLESDDGVAFRVPLALRRDDPAIWAWDASEEQGIADQPFTPIDLSLAVPEELAASTAGNVLSISFDTVPGASFYEWQWREGAGDWVAQPDLSADLDVAGSISATANVANGSAQHDVRVRTRLGAAASAWAEITINEV